MRIEYICPDDFDQIAMYESCNTSSGGPEPVGTHTFTSLSPMHWRLNLLHATSSSPNR